MTLTITPADPVVEDAANRSPAPAIPQPPVRRITEPREIEGGLPRRSNCSSLAAALARLAETKGPAANHGPVPHERRSLPRRESRALVRIGVFRNNAPPDEWTLRTAAQSEVVDLTLKSLAFLSDEPIAPRTRVVARLTKGGHEERVDVRGHVVRCRPVPEGHHVVVAFDRRLTIEDVDLFGRPSLPSSLV